MEVIGPSVEVTEATAESCGGSGFDSESVPLDEGGVSLMGEMGESRSLEPDESFVRFFLRNPPRLGMGARLLRSCSSSTGIPRRDLWLPGGAADEGVPILHASGVMQQNRCDGLRSIRRLVGVRVDVKEKDSRVVLGGVDRSAVPCSAPGDGARNACRPARNANWRDGCWAARSIDTVG